MWIGQRISEKGSLYVNICIPSLVGIRLGSIKEECELAVHQGWERD